MKQVFIIYFLSLVCGSGIHTALGDSDDQFCPTGNCQAFQATSLEDLKNQILRNENVRKYFEQKIRGGIFTTIETQIDIREEQKENDSDILGWYKASNNFLYKLFNDTDEANFGDAESQCATLGGRLASSGIRDKTIRSEIVDALNLSSVPRRETWIGLNDRNIEDHWVWSDGFNSTRTNTDWKSGEPNNSEENEDCAGLDKNHDFRITDFKCNVMGQYLCERVLINDLEKDGWKKLCCGNRWFKYFETSFNCTVAKENCYRVGGELALIDNFNSSCARQILEELNVQACAWSCFCCPQPNTVSVTTNVDGNLCQLFESTNGDLHLGYVCEIVA